MKNPVLKYLIGIVACEAILLLAWIGLAPDLDVTRLDSVRALLDSIPNQAPRRPEFLVAASAIRDSSRNINILQFVVLFTGLAIFVLSFLIGLRLLRDAKKRDIQSVAETK